MAASLNEIIENLRQSDQVQLTNIERNIPRMAASGLGDRIEWTLPINQTPNRPWVSRPSTPRPQPAMNPGLRSQMSLPILSGSKPLPPPPIKEARCYTCNSNTHLKIGCPKFTCPHCKKPAPNHLPSECTKRSDKKTCPKPYNKFKPTCTQCRLPLKYDHVAWARGLTDGYTCRCKQKAKKEEPSDEPDLYDSGYYDIYGDKDRNLNGEC